MLSSLVNKSRAGILRPANISKFAMHPTMTPRTPATTSMMAQLTQGRSASTFENVGRDFDIEYLELMKSTEQRMIEQPWTTTPFQMHSKLQLPVYNLIDGEFNGEVCNLDPKYFNQVLRRDIVSRVFHYFNVKGVVKTHVAKTSGDVAGTGKKPFPQKGRGAGRVGNKRAPQRKKGGVAHGPVCRDLTEKIPRKMRVKALQIMLSAKLFEDRIILIETEKLDHMKTQYLHEVVKPFGTDRLCFLTGFDQDNNFMRAYRNLKNITVATPQQFNIQQMMHSDLIFMTKDGLSQLEEIIDSRLLNLYRNRKVPRTEPLPSEKYLGKFGSKKSQHLEWHDIIKPTLEDERFGELFEGSSQEDGKVDLEIFTPSLQQYLDDLRALQPDSQQNSAADSKQ